MDIDFPVDKVCEVSFKSDISIQGIGFAELRLYLALTASPDLLTELGIADMCLTRNTTKGRQRTITVRGSEEQKEKSFKPWNLPVKQPDEYGGRVMLREALRVALTLIMKNHVTTRSGSKQKGTPIELKLTGVLAHIFMIWWDNEFAARLFKMGIVMRMNKRYVDDINLAIQAIPTGTKYKNGETYVDESC